MLSVEMALILSVFMVSLVVFVFIARRVIFMGKNEFDFRVFNYLQEHVSPRNNEVMLFFTYLGTHKFLIPANLALIAYFLFFKRHRWYSIKIPAIALSSLLLMFVLKNFFGRERPLIPLLEQASGLSFPSGHALMSVTFYGLLVYLVWHNIKEPWLKWTLIILLLLLIQIIGFSRIYLRVHYASDVMAGFAMGFLWLVICLKVLRRLEKYSRRNVDPIVQETSLPAA